MFIGRWRQLDEAGWYSCYVKRPTAEAVQRYYDNLSVMRGSLTIEEVKQMKCEYCEEDKPDWLSVEEGLPQHQGNVVICCDNNGNVFTAWTSKRKGVFLDEQGGMAMLGITHWMPLPEPPKEDD